MNELLILMIRKQRLPIAEINLVGGRYSGKSTAAQVLVGLAASARTCSLGIVFARASKDAGSDLMSDIISTFESFDIHYRCIFSKGEIIVGSTRIKVIGLNSMSKYSAKKSGFPKFNNVDYIIKVFEECFEFKPEEHKAVQEAIRHNMGDVPDYLTINICNP